MPVITFAPVLHAVEVTIMAEVIATGKLMYSVLHVRQQVEPTPGPVALGIITADFEAAMAASHLPVSNQIHCYAIRAKSLAENPAPEVTRPIDITGQKTGNMLPPQCAALTRLFADAPGPAGRGRIYNFPATENEQDAGRFAGVYCGELDSLWDNIRLQLVLNLSNLTVFSRTHNEIADVNTHETIRPVKTVRNREFGI